VTCDDHRARFLAEGATPAWSGHAGTCVACRAVVPELDSLRRRLADPDSWQSPGPGVEERVLDAVAGSHGRRRPGQERPRWWVAVAVAAALVLVVAGGLALNRDRPDWSLRLEAVDVPIGAGAVISGWNTAAGTRLELIVSGLPPAEGHGYYEIWMTSPDGAHVSAGTFRAGGRISTWAGVTRAEYPRIWITLEAGAGPDSSRTVIFDS
jgi:hypothetical protein